MFGEHVLYKLVAVGRSKATKMEPKFESGVFLGLVERTGVIIVDTADGEAARCRDFKERPGSERWIKDLVLRLKALPWAPSGEPEAADDNLPRAAARLETANGARDRR